MSLSSESPDWARVAEAEKDWAAPVLVTVVDTSGSTPRKIGARMLLEAVGECPTLDADLIHPEGSIGGGAVEAQGIRLGFEAWRRGGGLVRRIVLGAEMGMCCGGSMTLMAQPLVERPTLVIFGLGHVGAAAARLAAECGFRVVGVDGRAELMEQSRCWLDDALEDFDPETVDGVPDGAHVLVVTHDHALDQELVERLLGRPFASLQMLGSKRKALRCVTRLRAKGFAANDIDAFRSPAGMDIGAETPAEIALALVAYLVKLRRG